MCYVELIKNMSQKMMTNVLQVQKSCFDNQYQPCDCFYFLLKLIDCNQLQKNNELQGKLIHYSAIAFMLRQWYNLFSFFFLTMKYQTLHEHD